MATMLPIAWEETYQESVGIREDIHHLVCRETFGRATIMPNIKNRANNTELATIISQSTQMILRASMSPDINIIAFPTSDRKEMF